MPYTNKNEYLYLSFMHHHTQPTDTPVPPPTNFPTNPPTPRVRFVLKCCSDILTPFYNIFSIGNYPSSSSSTTQPTNFPKPPPTNFPINPPTEPQVKKELLRDHLHCFRYLFTPVLICFTPSQPTKSPTSPPTTSPNTPPTPQVRFVIKCCYVILTPLYDIFLMWMHLFFYQSYTAHKRSNPSTNELTHKSTHTLSNK